MRRGERVEIDGNAVKQWCDLIEQRATLIKERSGLRAGLVIIDAAYEAAGFGEGGTNSDYQVDCFLEAVDQVAARTGTWIVVIYHFGKDAAKGSRGSQRWYDKPRSVFHLSKPATSDKGKLTVVKSKLGSRGTTIGFELKKLTWLDEDGDEEFNPPSPLGRRGRPSGGGRSWQAPEAPAKDFGHCGRARGRRSLAG